MSEQMVVDLIRKHSPRQATANTDTTAGTSAGRRVQDDGYLERRVVIKGWIGTCSLASCRSLYKRQKYPLLIL
eukprot:5445101-Amphidinium_carterae.1